MERRLLLEDQSSLDCCCFWPSRALPGLDTTKACTKASFHSTNNNVLNVHIRAIVSV
jgi:hypothetical protein